MEQLKRIESELVPEELQMMDIVEQAYHEQREKGRLEGRLEGRIEEREEIAIKLMGLGQSSDYISSVTELTIQEIDSLRSKSNDLQ